jgi:hypothetical protein
MRHLIFGSPVIEHAFQRPQQLFRFFSVAIIWAPFVRGRGPIEKLKAMRFVGYR